MKADFDGINFARLKMARGSRPASQVARMIGISYQQLWNIETGKRRPSLKVLVKLCTLYGIPMQRIISHGRRAA